MTTLLQEALTEAALCSESEQDFLATLMMEHIRIFRQQNPHLASSKTVLDEFLSGVTDANKHGEISMGPAIGKEIW